MKPMPVFTDRAFLIDAMAYVALGTIADVAPLRGENRTMVYHGLRALAVSANPGIDPWIPAANRTIMLPSEHASGRRPEPIDVDFS